MSPLAYRTSVAEEDLGVPGQSRLLYRLSVTMSAGRGGKWAKSWAAKSFFSHALSLSNRCPFAECALAGNLVLWIQRL